MTSLFVAIIVAVEPQACVDHLAYSRAAVCRDRSSTVVTIAVAMTTYIALITVKLNNIFDCLIY